jgi:hypothetical protein
VLSRDIVLTELDPRHWSAWFELLVPQAIRDRPRWALAVIAGSPPRVERLLVAGHDARGAVDPEQLCLPPTQANLQACARKLGVGAILVVEAGVIRAVAAEVERSLFLDQDFAEHGISVWRALKQRSGKGVWSEPPLLDLLPAPSYDALQRTFDLLVPDDSALCAYVIEDDRASIAASVIAVKRRGDIATVATHRAIRDIVAETELARDWPTAYKRVIRSVADRYEKPCVGIFLERATFEKILLGPSDTLGRALNARRVIIDPAPTWLLGLLGGATVAALAQRGAVALAGLLPQTARDRAAGLADRARTAMKESGANPFAMLGFDPIELWLALRQFYGPRRPQRS